MSIFSNISFRLNAFVIGLVALSAIGVAAVGGMLSTLSFESHMRQVTFPALMNTVTNMVDRELIAPVGTLETLARNPFFTGWIASGGDEAQAAQVFAMGRELMRTHNTSGMNVVLRDSLRYFQFDGQTATVFTTSKERDSWFFDFEAGKNELGINIHAADDPLYPGMIFFNQRIDLNGKFAGIISTGMKLESVLDKLAGMAIGKHGTIMLARANGILLTHTNKGHIGKHLQDLPGYETAAANILAGRTAEFEYINAAGRRTLVLARQIPTLNLVLVSETDLDEQLADVQATKWYAMGSGLLFILIGGIAGFLLIRTVTGPLHTLMHIATTLTHNTTSGTTTDTGDMALPAAHYKLIRRNDELGDLARTLGTMVGSLQEASARAHKESVRAQEESVHVREAMREVDISKQHTEARTHKLMEVAKRLSTVAEIVQNASVSLEKHVQTADNGARAQAAHLEETATAMTEMTSTVLEVAKNSSVAAESSSSMRQRADNGAEVVRHAVDSIRRVQEQSTALKADMGRLGQSAQAISQIMGVISDIADQTNLLALNAAIEAARAGEAGRGFAVVADEVRKLAEKTMCSTIDVSNAIRAIQQSADNSLARMDAAVDAVSEATTLGEKSGAALDEIVILVDDVADQVRGIATAAEEQSATSEQINHSVDEVTTSSRETAQAMHEAAQAVIELTTQSRILTGLIDELNAS